MIIYLRKKRLFKPLTIGICLFYLQTLLAPGVAYALTSGPTSPEFSSFTPVATSDMVDVFSGDFAYNLPILTVPGPHGSGYPLSLSYQNVPTLEAEASWVGFGWTLNPGAINRNTRGFPDDFKESSVTYYNKTKPNFTASSTFMADLEAYSKNPIKALGLNYQKTVTYNNHTELSQSEGISFSFMSGTGTVGMDVSGGEVTLNGRINPWAFMTALKEKAQKKNMLEQKVELLLDGKYKYAKFAIEKIEQRQAKSNKILRNAYGITFYESPSKSNNLTKFYGFNLVTTVDVRPAANNIGYGVGWAGNLAYQISEAEYEGKAYGYMYNDVEVADNQREDDLYDYFLEKESNFNKRDYFVGIPFNNHDVFSVTGEGVLGGFRMYHDQIGEYYPKHVTSTIKNFEVGIEFTVGKTLGIGPKLGGGSMTSGMKNWPIDKDLVVGLDHDEMQFDNSAGSDHFFRFIGDKGGTVEYGQGGADISSATINAYTIFPGSNLYGYTMDDLTNSTPGINLKQTAGRSSYIDYHTNDDINNNQRFDNNTSSPGYGPGSIQGDDNSLAEFKVTSSSGQEFIYGLPVFSKNEYNISFDVHDGAVMYNNDRVFQDIDEDNLSVSSSKYIMGEHQPNAYASTHLLTQINTADYVDVGSDGPSDDDLGGWTKFTYKQKDWNNGNEKWFNWRSPYTGYHYSMNTVGKVDDDLASFSSGERQIYYMNTIETRTHIAYFVTNKSVYSDFANADAALSSYLTGSNEERYDGFSAAKYSSDNPGNNSDAQGDKDLLYLEKIVLVSKERPTKPLKVVHFEYDYRLGKKLPNSSKNDLEEPANLDYNNSGKLTLRKVWFEYEGTFKAKISPYVFDYEYKKSSTFPAHVLSKYPFLAETDALSEQAQNPDYSPFASDCWGNYRYVGDPNSSNIANGYYRTKNMMPWVYQGEPVSDFDPAAWQLKQITLPSGGQILIQYEQDDYAYVQDRKAMGMVRLSGTGNSNEYNDNNKYHIDYTDMGIDPGNANEVDAQLLLMQQYFADKSNRMYYKMLYSLAGSNPSITDCGSEYIEGYAVVDEVGKDANGIYVVFGSGGSDEKYDVPRRACYDYIIQERSVTYNACYNVWNTLEGDLENAPGGSYTSSVTANMDAYYSSRSNAKAFFTTGKKVLLQLSLLKSDPLTHPFKGTVCKTVNFPMSYFKVPLAKDKKGGGLRVKRLMMYSQGLSDDQSDASLFGTEYVYKHKLGNRSSGVAANEPSTIRFENALVGFLPRMAQNKLNKIIFGRDKKQVEGPIGESLLPGASVGYSRVTIKNIHDDPKTGTGYSVHSFYTTKDYPFDKNYSGINGEVSGSGAAYSELDNRDHKRKNFLVLPTPFLNIRVNGTYLSQGFRFIQNNMNGQIKSIQTFNGVPNDGSGSGTPNSIMTRTEYEYYEPGEYLKSLKYDGNDYTVENILPGKETDLTIDNRMASDNGFGLSLEIDVVVEIEAPPRPGVSFGGLMLNYTRNTLASHTISKVISYPAIVKSVTYTVDNITSKTENVLFDELTGNPIVIKTTDGYDGLTLNSNNHNGTYYSVSLPAHFYYNNMGQIAHNPSNTNQLEAVAGSITTYGLDDNSKSPDEASWYSGQKTNVVAAQYLTYSNSFGSLPGSNESPKPIYRPEKSYVYKPQTIIEANVSSTNSQGRNYTGGVFDGVFTFFEDDPSKTYWQPSVAITKYTAHGEPVEEVNALNIYSCAHFGYGASDDLPTLVAANAKYNDVGFVDFEVSSDPNVTTSYSHSGKKSRYQDGSVYEVFSSLDISSNTIEKGIRILAWVKSDDDFNASDLQPLPLLPNTTNMIQSSKIARVGEWVLVEHIVKFPNANLNPVNTKVKLQNLTGNDIYLDDVKVQPLDAQLKCFVYDPNTYRLVTEFGDSHFGLYYQYDQEGRLLRKLIETEYGIKTVQETYTNIPLQDRQ